jgi:alpha-D-ribose 1-methylphosphonate 5-triphosphate diphosphatase
MEAVFTNGRLVLDDRIVAGTLVVRDGLIAEISDTPARTAIDLGGDLLLPGLVELHTDNLEKHLVPRPDTRWPALAAVVGHDAQIAAAGITTVLDALALGDVSVGGDRLDNLAAMVAAIRTASDKGMLRADHLLHLRCEISHPEVVALFDELLGDPLLKLVSIMDHTPGQRQFRSLDWYRAYHQKAQGWSEPQAQAFIDRQLETARIHSGPNRRAIVTRARAHGLPLASHDDATLDQVEEAAADGMAIAEFPTTREAAVASHARGLAILMGSPNVVRGGSRSGNVSALELAALGLLDLLSSDYVPQSLLHGAFILAALPGWDLPRAIRTVAGEPAARVQLADRGRLAPGLRADLLRVEDHEEVPLVRGVWVGGSRVI